MTLDISTLNVLASALICLNAWTIREVFNLRTELRVLAAKLGK